MFLVALALVALLCVGGHALAAALFRMSLFRAEFWRAPIWKRLIVFAAGPMLAYLLAASSCFVMRWISSERTWSVTIDTVSGPARAAGILDGDRVVAIDSAPIKEWPEIPKTIERAGNREVEVVVERNGVQQSIRVTPVAGKIGIRPREVRTPTPLVKAAASGLVDPIRYLSFYVEGIRESVAGRVPQFVTGPVGIVSAGRTPGEAWMLVISLSLSLAVVLILPVDVLLFGMVSIAVRRRNPSQPRSPAV